MNKHLVKVSLALLSAVFILGCQDMGTGVVASDGQGPQFGGVKHPGPHNKDDDGSGGGGLIYDRPGGLNDSDGYTCDGGAAIIADDPSFGQVTWGNIRRTDNHIHGTFQLSGLSIPEGRYQIVGSQDALCGVDFRLRNGHSTWVDLDGNGGGATVGLTFGSQAQIPVGHAPGKHKLWLTIRGPGIEDPNAGQPESGLKPGDLFQKADGTLLDGPEGDENTMLLPLQVVLRSTAVEVVIKKHKGH